MIHLFICFTIVVVEMASARFSEFSYRLKISMEPDWAEIIRQAVGLKDEREQREFGLKLPNPPQPDRMLHKRYDFTEFFDSRSGLTVKFQRIHLDGATYSGFVKGFRDGGYLFGRTNPLLPEEQNDKCLIEVTEHSIGIGFFDRNIGSTFTNDPIFAVPIDALLEFGVALQLRFPDLTTSHVLKWPESIEMALQRRGTQYKTMFDFTPDERDLEDEDREFFERYGRPKLATTASWPTPYFLAPSCYYCIELEVFDSKTAKHSSRLAVTNFPGNGFFGLD